MSDHLPVFLASGLLALGFLGFYVYKTEYNEDSESGSDSGSESDLSEIDISDIDSEEKPRRKKTRTYNKKNSKKRRY